MKHSDDCPQAPSARMPEAARLLLQARCEAVRESASYSLSPCVSVCRMDDASGLCLGCLRSLAEIADWAAMGAAQRVTVWRSIDRRLHGGVA